MCFGKHATAHENFIFRGVNMKHFSLGLKNEVLLSILMLISYFLLSMYAEAALTFDFQWSIAQTSVYANGTAVDSNGNVYVTDSCGVSKYDSNGNLLMSWGECGAGNGQFDGAEGIAIDGLNNVYVADHYNNRVQKIDVNGNYIGELYANLPYAVGVDRMNNIYIPRPYSINKYDSSGTWLGNISIPSSAPQGIAVNSQGNIYVTDMTANKVYKLDSDGTQLATWGGIQGNGPGEFWAPTGIVIDNFNT